MCEFKSINITRKNETICYAEVPFKNLLSNASYLSTAITVKRKSCLRNLEEVVERRF